MKFAYSFIVITFNNANTIEICLASIATLTSGSFEVVVVDNSPGVETSECVRRFMVLHPAVNVRLIERHENIGFSRGCNLGAQSAGGEYLFFLNPDTQLLNDAASQLVRCFELNPRTLAAGAGTVNASGRIAKTCRTLPTLLRVALDITGLDHWFGAYKLKRFNHESARPVEQIIGAAIFMRRGDYERLGGMDEQFFIYFEEVDLCKRLKEAGGEIWFWPEARVKHLEGRSCEADAVRARMIFVLRESRRKYFAKHFGRLAAWLMEGLNRFEGVGKSAVLAVLWILRRKQAYRDKAWGFWAVATGIRPPG